MNMTREEASVQIEGLKKYCEDMADSDESGAYVFDLDVQALDLAISALRPVSREQVEEVWRGCEYCGEEWGTCNPITNRFTMPPRGGIRLCPMCGKPLTDEAVEMVLERLEVLEDAD